MAPPKNNTLHAVQQDVALLKQTTTMLEHTVVAQNASIKTELDKMNGVLREIHDKLDSTILTQTVEVTKIQGHLTSNNLAAAIEFTKHQGMIEANSEGLKSLNTRLSRTAAAIVGIFTAIAGSVTAWPWFKPGP